MQFTHTPYYFATELANNNRQFGMWVPNANPADNNMIQSQRFAGQEGAAPGAANFSWDGGTVIVPALWRSLDANPLLYVEGGAQNERRKVVSEWLDSNNPDLTPFYRKSGRLISIIGTGDARASSGAQVDYFDELTQFMGRERLDRFARLYVMPHMGHGLSANNYGINGDGVTIPTAAIPNTFDRVGALTNWVENNVAPGQSVEVTASAGARSLPLCTYPAYPRYKGVGAPVGSASSYECAVN